MVMGFVVIVSLACALAAVILGLVAYKRQEPVNFWLGTELSVDELSDPAAYNRKCGNMMLLYSLAFWFCAGLAPFAANLACTIMGLQLSFGMLWLIRGYRKIERQFVRSTV